VIQFLLGTKGMAYLFRTVTGNLSVWLAYVVEAAGQAPACNWNTWSGLEEDLGTLLVAGYPRRSESGQFNA